MSAKKLKISALLSYAAIFAYFCYQLLLTPLLIRKLGADEYGLYSVSMSFIGYLALMGGGLSSAYLKFYFEYGENGQTEKISQLNGASILIFGIAGALATLAGCAFSFGPSLIFGTNMTADELRLAVQLLRLIGFSAGISMLAVSFENIAFVHERFIFIKSFQCLRFLMMSVLSVVLLMRGYHSTAVICIWLAVCVFYCIGNIVFVFKRMRLKLTFTGLHLELFKKILAFASFIFISSILEIINAQLDKVLIINFHGAKSAGIYSVGAQFNMVILQLGMAITSLYVPRVNKLAAADAKDCNVVLTKALCQTGRIQFMITSLIYSGLVFFGRPFIRFFAGQGYETAYYVALLLTFPLVILMSMDLGQHIIRAKNLHRKLILTYLAVSLLFLCVRVPLIRMFGIIGAAAGTSATLIVTQIMITYSYFNRAGGLRMGNWLRSILSLFPALIIPVICGMAIAYYANLYSLLWFFVCGFIYTAIFALCMWAFGMNTMERDIFRKPVRGLIRRWRRPLKQF